MTTAGALTWSTLPFAELYTQLQSGAKGDALLASLSEDLAGLASIPGPSEASRKTLTETKRVELTVADETMGYTLNEEFLIEAAQLSEELGLDQGAAALLLAYASQTESQGTSFLDSGRLAFYNRRSYILYIVSYLLNHASDAGFTAPTVDAVLASMAVVEAELKTIKQKVDKFVLLDKNNVPLTLADYALPFMQGVQVRRQLLRKQHQTLGEILHGVVARTPAAPDFTRLLAQANTYSVDDSFVLHLLPAQLCYLTRMADDAVKPHLTAVQALLAKPDLPNRPFEAFLCLMFLVHALHRVQTTPHLQTHFPYNDFNTGVLTAIGAGAMEQFMCITAETGVRESAPSEVRTLLEQHLPRLVPVSLLDVDVSATKKYLDDGAPRAQAFSPQFLSLTLPLLHDTVYKFVKHYAVVLVTLKNAEEDALLSKDDDEDDSDLVNLDELSERADLERFYLAVSYLYAERPELSSAFWKTPTLPVTADTTLADESISAITPPHSVDLYGFLEWAAKVTTSPLITHTFCMMVAALASGSSQNAENAYRLLTSGTGTITLTSILGFLGYYHQALAPVETARDAVVALLGEDSVVFIAGFLLVLKRIAQNGSETVKQQLGEAFTSILFQFLQLESFPLVGEVLEVLLAFPGSHWETRLQLWRQLDEWLFEHEAKPVPFGTKEPMRNLTRVTKTIRARLGSSTNRIGFVRMVLSLLRPGPTGPSDKMRLQFPYDLGSGYRAPGVWPYVEFLMTDVLVGDLKQVHGEVLSLLLTVLTEFDFRFLLAEAPETIRNLQLDEAVYQEAGESVSMFGPATTAGFPPTFKAFVQAHPALAVINYLFSEEVYLKLFRLLAVGVDSLADATEEEIALVRDLLRLLMEVLHLQEAFASTVVPVLKAPSAVYIPSARVGTHGLTCFEEAFQFHLPVVAHIALYVGAPQLDVATLALDILSRLATSAPFDLGSPSRLFTCLSSVDESSRIRFAMMTQLDSSIDSTENLVLKHKLLRFLCDNLGATASLSHFLLGFVVKTPLALALGSEAGTVGSDASVLRSVIQLLVLALASLRATDIEYAPMRVAAMSLELIVRLCQDRLSGTLVMGHLREAEFLTVLLRLVVRVDRTTLWDSQLFDGNVGADFSTSSGPGALLSFVDCQNSILAYTTMELYELSRSGSLSLLEAFVTGLVLPAGFLRGAPQVLTFLDVLEFEFSVDVSAAYAVDARYNVGSLLARTGLKDRCDGGVYDMLVLESTCRLELKRAVTPRCVMADGTFLADFTSSYLSHQNLTRLQRGALQRWVQLVQVLVGDGMLPSTRLSLVLEVLQYILPKIGHYYELNVVMAEELVSLCVHLYTVYENDRCVLTANVPTSASLASMALSATRMLPLFQTCLTGIMCSLSSLALRADLYVLANRYLVSVTSDEAVITKLLRVVKPCAAKLIDVVCSDAINGEGAPRITSLLLMDALCHLGARSLSNFVLYSLLKNNYLSLLVRSIKRTDEIIAMCKQGSAGGISVETVLYELTAFKTTVYLLIRVAESKQGAQQLVQSELFKTIRRALFLLVDPDLGMALVLGETATTNVNFLLDRPLQTASTTVVSYYELLVPVFQLVAATLVSMGATNHPVIEQVRELMAHFEKLTVGVIKRDALEDDGVTPGLTAMVSILVMLAALTEKPPPV